MLAPIGKRTRFADIAPSESELIWERYCITVASATATITGHSNHQGGALVGDQYSFIGQIARKFFS